MIDAFKKSDYRSSTIVGAAIALLSILSFIFKIKNLNLITKSIAPIGLLFTCIAIITGSLWGQPTWGTWWAWDARIT